MTVSVIIISHNYGRFLDDAIGSVIAQARRHDEILIVDDASDDDTFHVADRAQETHSVIRYEFIDAHSLHTARKIGFENTTGDLVVFLDADDMLTPGYLEAAIPLFDDPQVGIVYADLDYFGDQTEHIEFPTPEWVDLSRYNRCHSCSVVRRTALEASGAFDESRYPTHIVDKGHSDWFLWRKVVEAGWKLAKSTGLSLNRRHKDQMSARRAGITYYDGACLELEQVAITLRGSGVEWLSIRPHRGLQMLNRGLGKFVVIHDEHTHVTALMIESLLRQFTADTDSVQGDGCEMWRRDAML